MALEADVEAMVDICKIDTKAEGWLIVEGILDLEGVATLAANEALVDPKIVQVLIASGATE